MKYSKIDIGAGEPKLHVDCHRHALHEHSLQAELHACITKYVTLSHCRSKGSVVL